jgi:hypothetical protein
LQKFFLNSFFALIFAAIKICLYENEHEQETTKVNCNFLIKHENLVTSSPLSLQSTASRKFFFHFFLLMRLDFIVNSGSVCWLLIVHITCVGRRNDFERNY